MDEDIAEMKRKAKDVLLAVAFKESMMGRSIHFSEKEEKKNIDKNLFKKETINSAKKLRELVDIEKITNADIRNEIQTIHEKTHVSVGQAQKVINIYLKGYCLLLDKSDKIIKELDCPLDKNTLKGYHKALKDIEDMKEYESLQDKFEKENRGIRLLRDRVYDDQRLQNQ